MKVLVVSGSRKVSKDALLDIFHAHNEDKNAVFIEFPEYSNNPHPADLFQSVMDALDAAEKEKKNVYLCTWSDHALNAVRVYVHNAKNPLDAFVEYHMKKNESTVIAVMEDGRLNSWPNNCDFFCDVYDNAIMQLM